MSIKVVIVRYEDEAAELKEKMDALQQRKDVVDLMLKELRSASRGTGRKKKAATKGKKAAKGKKATAGKKATGRKKGGLTVRDAILKTVAGAKNPLPAKEIIAGAVKLSGGAIASIRTQINSLAKGGLIKQVPYEGRGFRYAAGGGKAAAPKPSKKVSKKPAAAPVGEGPKVEQKKAD